MFQAYFIYWQLSISFKWSMGRSLYCCQLCIGQIKFSESEFQAVCRPSSPLFQRVQSCADDNRNLALKSERSSICFARLAVVTHHVSLLSWFWILLVCDWTLHNKIFSPLAEQEVSCRLKWLQPNPAECFGRPSAVHLVFVWWKPLFCRHRFLLCLPERRWHYARCL